MKRRETVDNRRAEMFEEMAHAIEQRHQGFEGEDAERGETIRSREREQFWNQIAKQNDDGEDDRGREPLRYAACAGPFPKEEKTEDHEWNIHERIAEKEDVK